MALCAKFGYDILNFGMNAECKVLGLGLFPSCADNADCVNTEFVKIQHDYVEVITKNYTQHTALNVLGTLQHAGGDTKAKPGNPDLTQWSPSNLMEDNCIHASQVRFACSALHRSGWLRLSLLCGAITSNMCFAMH